MMRFDALVIGGGHAGAEAARALARGGMRTALLTMARDSVGRMSCNPAIGGLAKGNLVREIDALGGLMAEATDAAGIQFRILNRSRGPAVQGPRAQCDRDLYAAAVRNLLDAEPNLTILEGLASRLSSRADRITGIVLQDGTLIAARAVLVTTGTFLRGLMHSGEQTRAGGRFGEPAAESLSDSLRSLGLRLGRLKTGTPPRVLRSSADFSRMQPQPGDERPRPFSIDTDRISLPQVLCWLTHTAPQAHELIRANLHRAPMYSGRIVAAGPRYCPSIEDKVVRFAEKERHLVFVEPEGLDHPWLYLNGISTSLPPDVQEGVVRSIPGLENAEIARWGYAVEYDFVNPDQLDPTLAVRGVEGLWLAGQINGTSGYEEAAVQGLLAGINALEWLRGGEPLVLRRDQAYGAVLIDDLVTLGTEEPYRMFTSRAEHRLLLGCDSVYERLSPLAAKRGLLSEERRRRIEGRIERMGRAREALGSIAIVPDRESAAFFDALGVTVAAQSSIGKLLQRPEFAWEAFAEAALGCGRWAGEVGTAAALGEEELEGVLSALRYAGYVEKQEREAAALREADELRIPGEFRFERPGLSREIVEKLNALRPRTLGQASRIRGMTPAGISILRMHLRSV
ncbi:MAG TPA: tRNA uridine-5-carboxymethylaminomethyl(34) synthesis enzyme MnmG [Thermoanaerobaculia bacterium]|nr:tRNA uridine-5-carboxymethylaminomethyl(34) synthesis enzyme MnmG [Thermoanaerobaculia bacterium]